MVTQVVNKNLVLLNEGVPCILYRLCNVYSYKAFSLQTDINYP